MIKELTLKNLTYILHDVDVYQKIDAEEFVIDLYKKLGHNVMRAKNFTKIELGLPDLYVEDGFFIEVKTNGDGLKAEQLEWIKNNPDKKVIAFHLKQHTQDKAIKKLRKDEIKKKEEFEEMVKLSKEAQL